MLRRWQTTLGKNVPTLVVVPEPPTLSEVPRRGQRVNVRNSKEAENLTIDMTVGSGVVPKVMPTQRQTLSNTQVASMFED